MKTPSLCQFVCLGLLAALCDASPVSLTVIVPGTSDPWLAGMPNGTTASGTDRAPAQSPVLAEGLSFAHGAALVFTSTGGVGNYSPIPVFFPPEGNLLHIPAHGAAAENGIGSATLPMNSLVGIFLGRDQPSLTTAPSLLEFTEQPARDYLTLRPALKQVFFIGDGRTSDGQIQEVVPPAGATRLFLGTMDEWSWNDNIGSFSVTVTETNANASQNLIVNGSFESPFRMLGANYIIPANELDPWQTAESAFLIWASSLPNEQASHGKQHLEVVSAWQTVATIPGQDYRLSFHHTARPGVDSTLGLSINAQLVRTFAENGSTLTEFKWRRYGTNFTATTNLTTLRFDGSGVPGNAHVDNVVLERLPLASSLRVSEVELCWETVATRLYQVQFRSLITANNWIDLLPPIQGTGGTNCLTDVVPAGEPQRFYRVNPVP